MNRTEQLIENAFSELLEEMPYNKITVKSIIERCGINRNTFYYHYESIPALAIHMVSSQIQEILEKQGPSGAPLDYILPIIDYILSKKKALLHVYNSIGREYLMRALRNLCRTSFKDYMKRIAEKRGLSEEDSSVLLLFYQSAFLGVLFDWIDSGFSYNLKNVVIRLDNLLGLEDDRAGLADSALSSRPSSSQ